MAAISFRACRQPAVICICIVDFLWLFMNYVANTKLKRFILLALLSMLVIWWSVSTDIQKVGQYSRWQPKFSAQRQTTTKHFVVGRNEEIYMYSAIANYQKPVQGAINIVVTTLDGSRSPLQCCVLLDNQTLFTTPAEEFYFYHSIEVTFIAKIMESFHPEIYFARQYVCSVPEIGQHAGHVTLTSSTCSPDIRDYLPVTYPPSVPGGLGICAKIAHSGGLDPEKVIEWFEVQKILGVDKVLMYDLGNPDHLTRVFRYYQESGLLDLLPYELPGHPSNRTLMEKDKRTLQFHHDESMAVLECRARMSGYTYLISHDLDEFIIPRKDVGLKEFLKEKMEIYQDSAGFYFETEFFIYNWGPTNPEQDLMLTRYTKATKPHRECTKHVHLPSRALTITTHDIVPLSPFTTYRLGPTEAILHHYRRCPDDVWPTCFPETILDNVMMRYHDLHQRVLKVRAATNTKPTWKSPR